MLLVPFFKGIARTLTVTEPRFTGVAVITTGIAAVTWIAVTVTRGDAVVVTRSCVVVLDIFLGVT